MVALLVETAIRMRNFAHRENIAHSLHSNTKLEAAVGKPKPLLAVVPRK
jgi:hypothetical protein